MPQPVLLSPWVHWTKLFQERPLLNRAVLDTVGYAVPSILLTRNPIERKEQTLDRILVIGSAFFLAPLHAWLFLRLFSRKLPSEMLMRLSYKDLFNTKGFQAALPRLKQELLQDSLGKQVWAIPKRLLTDNAFANRIRQQVIQQKSHMLLWDLLTEALIFTNLRFVTNWFTRTLTGKNQFSGEYGVAEQEKLDKLHQKNKQGERFTEQQKQIFNTVLALLVPPLVALGLRRAMLQPQNQSFWAKGLRRIAGGFDYNKGIYLGMGALGVIIAMQLLGYAMAARDKYELREKMLVQNIGNFIFFFGNWTWMQLLGRTILGQSKLPAVRSVQEAMDKVAKQGGSMPKVKQASRWAATFYWLCFLLNNLSFASLVVATNKSTVQQVKTDVAQLEQSERKQHRPAKPVPPAQPFPLPPAPYPMPQPMSWYAFKNPWAYVPTS